MSEGGAADWKILIDTPAASPALEYPKWAGVLANVISTSNPHFAVGIFGPWGCGKTTLMEAIAQHLDPKICIPVRFNAWRYEREPHVIVPLVDVIRDDIAMWGEAHEEPRATGYAKALGRLAQQVSGAITMSVGPTGSPNMSIDVGKILEPLPQRANKRIYDEATNSQSIYQATYTALQEVVRRFVRTRERLDKRIVVFVDDLDRCLPANVLDMLETMKLLFDIEGVVFVIGVDPRALQRAIDYEYRSLDREGAGPPEPGINATQYLHKMFQVPFTVPRIDKRGLPALVRAISRELPRDQRDDLMRNVLHHLDFLSSDDVNPREIKRFINAYTLQVKLASAVADAALKDSDKHALLSALLLQSNAGWTDVHELLNRDSRTFVALVRHIVEGGERPEGTAAVDVPDDFARYVRERGGSLLNAAELPEIVASMQLAGRRSRRIGVEALARIGALEATLQAPEDSPAWREAVQRRVLELSGELRDDVRGLTRWEKDIDAVLRVIASAAGVGDDGDRGLVDRQLVTALLPRLTALTDAVNGDA